MAGLTCWVGCAMHLWVTALLCCYLVGVQSWDARIWSAILPADERGATAGAARRVTTSDGLVLPVLVCGERGCVSSEPTPPCFGGGRWLFACCCEGVYSSSARYTMVVPAAEIVAPNRGEINRHHFGPRSQNCGALPRRNNQAQTVGLV